MTQPGKRHLPATSSFVVLMGTGMGQLGWLLLGFGGIFFWGFAMNADLSALHFRGEIVTVEGVATNLYGTGASVNDNEVFENHFRFTTPEGTEFESFSYTTGGGMEAGETVRIEYPAGKPGYSRIVGMRRQLFGPAVLLVTLLPAVGLIFLLVSIRRSLRAIGLLQGGELTTAKLVSKDPTNVKVNDRMVYKLTFAYVDQAGKRFEVIEKTHQTAELEDEEAERVLYQRDNPSNAVLLDALPASLHIDAQGKIEALPLYKTIGVAILPLLTIVGHGSYIWLKWLNN